MKDPVNFMAYGDFKDPTTGLNFVVIRMPAGRVPWKKKIVPAINQLVKPWFQKGSSYLEWSPNGEAADENLWATKVASRYLWDGEKLVKQS